MKKILIINALILTATSLLLRTVGISFRVYISNKIGPEGMGLYQLIFSIYALAATFATSGISTAVTRIVAEEQGKGIEAVSKIVRVSFALSLVVSTTSSAALFWGAEFVGTQWLHDARTVMPLKILAPSLPFVALSSCLRGYFYGVRKVIKSASAQLLEQFIKMLIIIAILSAYSPNDLEVACAAVVLGNTAAEILSCAYAFVLYSLEKKKTSNNHMQQTNQKNILSRMLSISLPIAASSYLRTGLKTVENILIPLGLERFGNSNKASLAEFGLLKGMVMPILTFPFAFLSAFSTLLIPEISEANAFNQKRRLDYAITRVFQLTLLSSILFAGVFMTFSKELGMAIYHRNEVGIFLKLLAPLIPFMYLDRVVDGMLKGLNQQVSSLMYNIIDSLARIGLIYYLIPMKGLSGFIIVIAVSTVLSSYLSIGRLLKVTSIKFKFVKWVMIPAFSIAVSGFITPFIFEIIGREYALTGIPLTLEILLFSIIYLIFLMLFNCISKDDVDWFKQNLRPKKSVI